jgi:exodeoxyribonuclease V alpha subunit
VVNAHRINAGQPPGLTGFADFFWFACDEPEQTADLVVDIVSRRIPARFGLNPRRDVQVLCPMHRGPAGAGNLNLLLQEALTPSREGQPERRYGGRVFRVGDKVTQLRNNYEKGASGVFNGTVGMVTGLSVEDHTVTVLTDEDEQVDYGFDELDELAHAYAVTIHRSQGSEYPAVVIPLTMASWMMLQRNLLYTAVTRAKKLVVLAGSRRALGVAVRTKGAGRRHTALAHRLRTQPLPIRPEKPQPVLKNKDFYVERIVVLLPCPVSVPEQPVLAACRARGPCKSHRAWSVPPCPSRGTGVTAAITRGTGSRPGRRHPVRARRPGAP